MPEPNARALHHTCLHVAMGRTEFVCAVHAHVWQGQLPEGMQEPNASQPVSQPYMCALTYA
jgi:hypothetical protein